MPRLLMIDNYDSFTYNLVQYLGELGANVDVVRNDVVPLDELVARAPDGLVISPGPGRPEDAGVTVPAVRAFGERGIPVLGVCLGHQGIGEAFGGRIVGARVLMHGKTSSIHHDERGLFAGLPSPFEATRYHSLVIERERCPRELEISAWTEDGEIMGVRHRALPVEGVQFHPESILTHEGKRLLANFLARCGPERGSRARGRASACDPRSEPKASEEAAGGSRARGRASACDPRSEPKASEEAERGSRARGRASACDPRSEPRASEEAAGAAA